MLGYLLFWRRSRAMCLNDVMLFMYLIDVASVSQLCYLPFYYLYYMGCCEDCLTCDIAFNAVMPLVVPRHVGDIAASRALQVGNQSLPRP